MSTLTASCRRGGPALLALLLLPAGASAQRFERGEIRAYGGAFLPEEASALDAAAVAGVRAGYQITPWLDVAVNASGTRALTQTDFFRPAVLRFTNRIELWDVRQNVTLVQYGGEIGLSANVGALRPYLNLGGGGYTLFLDSQTNQAARRITSPQLTGALGASYQINERSGINLEVRDHMLLDYDRDALNPVDPEQQDQVFVEMWPTPPEAKDRINALILSVGFTYHP